MLCTGEEVIIICILEMRKQSLWTVAHMKTQSWVFWLQSQRILLEPSCLAQDSKHGRPSSEGQWEPSEKVKDHWRSTHPRTVFFEHELLVGNSEGQRAQLSIQGTARHLAGKHSFCPGIICELYSRAVGFRGQSNSETGSRPSVFLLQLKNGNVGSRTFQGTVICPYKFDLLLIP